MSNPWDKFVEKTDAQIIGGELIAIIDKKHTVVGHISAGQLVLNPAGLALDAPARKTKKGDAAGPENAALDEQPAAVSDATLGIPG